MKWRKVSHRREPTESVVRGHLRRIGSSTGGRDRLEETQRFGVPMAALLGLVLAATLLVACSGDRPSGDTAAVQIPETPVGSQLEWVMAQLNGGADTLTEEDVVEHFAPGFLQTYPPQELIEMLRGTSAQAGHVTLTGFSPPFGSTEAIGLITAQRPVQGSKRAAAYVNVEEAAPHRITYLNLGDLPGPSARQLAAPGPYTGAFDVGGGRTLFLNCAGSGSPTVILEAGAGGGANAWTKVQPEVASLARVCSYDRANIPGGASDPAPKPRTAGDVGADLHTALTAAGVPGPFVLVGHSDGGLFVRLYASRYPEQVVSLVLVDAVSEDLDTATSVLLKDLLTEDQWRGYRAALEQQAQAPFVARVDDEQVDIAASSAEMRAILADSPLRPMPLFVLTHGVPDPSSPDEPPAFAQAKERVWQELQRQLARLVPNAKHLIVRDSGHIIQEEKPEVVIDAIRQVVEAVREPGTW
jgi:pimeloyl-ACP methyl ester carboxylesterase